MKHTLNTECICAWQHESVFFLLSFLSLPTGRWVNQSDGRFKRLAPRSKGRSTLAQFSIANLKSKNAKIFSELFFKLLKWNNLMLFSLVYHCKLNMFWPLTVCRTKEAKTVKGIFQYCLTFYRPWKYGSRPSLILTSGHIYSQLLENSFPLHFVIGHHLACLTYLFKWILM